MTKQAVSNLSLHLRVMKESLGIGKTKPQDTKAHLDAAMKWLCLAQDKTMDDGVSQTYLIKSLRWANSYPETTGYIVPSFYRYWALTGNEDYRDRAKRMVDWECEIQLPEGGVLAGALGDSDKPTIFNTGQVLFGWARAYEIEKDERYSEAGLKAALWLCDVMDEDGCWRKFGSPMTLSEGINVYNTRSAWGMVRIHEITGEQRVLDCAIKNLEWALTQAKPNGWLENNCLQNNEQPFLHTIAYAMRGFLEIGLYANREDFMHQAIKIGDAMLSQLPANGFMPGCFDKDWNPAVKWSCLTGNAQMAINWGRLYKITGEEKYREAVVRINAFTKTTQKLAGGGDEVGGIKGSHPVNGGYHPWQIPNWPAKFFADALATEGYLSGEFKFSDEKDLLFS